MTERHGNQTDRPQHVEFYLSGDLSSPFELLSATELSTEQKREVLEVWHGDLMRRGGRERHEELLGSIEFAMKSLSPLNSGSKAIDG